MATQWAAGTTSGQVLTAATLNTIQVVLVLQTASLLFRILSDWHQVLWMVALSAIFLLKTQAQRFMLELLRQIRFVKVLRTVQTTTWAQTVQQ